MKAKTKVQPITPEADAAKRTAAGELPPTPGVYSRAFVAPRPVPPNPNQFAHPDDASRAQRDYVAKRDAWKRDYPNLHTAEEEAAHVADMRARGVKGGAS